MPEAASVMRSGEALGPTIGTAFSFRCIDDPTLLRHPYMKTPRFRECPWMSTNITVSVACDSRSSSSLVWYMAGIRFGSGLDGSRTGADMPDRT